MRGGGIRRETTEPGEGGGAQTGARTWEILRQGSAGQHRLTQHAASDTEQYRR